MKSQLKYIYPTDLIMGGNDGILEQYLWNKWETERP